jgi:hypothetical protein
MGDISRNGNINNNSINPNLKDNANNENMLTNTYKNALKYN